MSAARVMVTTEMTCAAIWFARGRLFYYAITGNPGRHAGSDQESEQEKGAPEKAASYPYQTS